MQRSVFGLLFRRCNLTLTKFLAAMDRCSGTLLRRQPEMGRRSGATAHGNRVPVVTLLPWNIAPLPWGIAIGLGPLHYCNGASQLNNGALQYVFGVTTSGFGISLPVFIHNGTSTYQRPVAMVHNRPETKHIFLQFDLYQQCYVALQPTYMP